jgi:hypothetical protein
VLSFIIGILGGIVAGMGMGGGTLLIPLLTLFLGFNQKEAQTLTLVSFVCMAGIVIFIHIKNKLIDFKTAIWFVLLGLPASVATAFVVQGMGGNLLKILFGIFLISLSIVEFINIGRALKNTRLKN